MVQTDAGATCALKACQELERRRATLDSDTVRDFVRQAYRCGGLGLCPDMDYCAIACAGLLTRLTRH